MIYDVSRAYDIVYLDFQKAFDKVPHDKLNVWNSLPGLLVEAETLGVFKTRFDTVLDTI